MFKLGLFNAIFQVSRILRIWLFSAAENNIFQENLWLKFSFKYFCRFRVFRGIFYLVPIAILRYVWCRRCLFVHRHITLTISFIKHRISLSYIKDINEICRYNTIILNVTIIFFIELSDDTIYKFRGIISTQNFLFNCLYLLRNSTRNLCYSV